MEFEYDFDKESPFQPGKPVSPDYFSGRKKILAKILRYVNKAHNGDAQHYFITGERGIGKTSLAKYVQNLTDDKMIGVYVSNKGNESLEVLTTQIIEGILSKLPKDSVIDKAKKIFGDHIECIEIKGTKVNFRPGNSIGKDLVNNFAYYLNKIYKDIPNNKGIFLIIDDINGLSESGDFANWYKRLVDIMEFDEEYKILIYFLLASYPQKFQRLVNQDESFARIFHYDDMDYLSNEEVKEFFIDTFKTVGMICEEDALEIMITFSSGLPLMMQEIGEAVFWETDGKIVTKSHALTGVIEAGKLIGARQIKPVMDKSIRSENYESILLKLGEHSVDYFKKSDFEPKLTQAERNVFHKFLQRATELNISESVGKDKSGEYRFSNRLNLVYFMILNLDKNKSLQTTLV